ncbi:MAG: IPT/TIG domain-containing protein, partial [Actinomycetota bacterium]|nr:IPT/TIG domain-containing protein [Actinomycetota bacterium]
MAGLSVAGIGIAVLLACAASPASASPTGSCTASGTDVVLTVSGAGPADSGLVTVSAGDYVFAIDGTHQCQGQTFAAAAYPVVQIAGSTLDTTFQPGTASGVTFAGEPGAGNTLDLSGESSSSFTSLTVAMSSTACGGNGSLTSTGAVSLSDCFANVGTVDGAASVPTVFEPDPTLTTTPSSVPIFVGQDSSAGGSVVDLSAVDSPANALEAAMNGDSAASPGQASATVSGTAVTYAKFYGVDTVEGSATQATDFHPDLATTGVSFAGSTGAGQTNTLDLSNIQSTSGVTVSLRGTSASTEKATLTTSSGTDSALGITTFVGSNSGSTTFVSDGFGGHTFEGGGTTGNSMSFGNVASGGSGVTVTMTGTGGTASGLSSGIGGSTTDQFSNVENVDGSPNNDTFEAGPGAYTFGGGGGSDTLSFASTSSGVTFNLAGSTPTVAGTGIDDTVSGFITFVGSSQGGNTFAAPATGDLTFTGQGAGNTLSFGAVTSTPLTVDAGTGSATGTGFGDAFSGISSFLGASSGKTSFVAPATGGLTFTGQGAGNTLDLTNAPGAAITVHGDSAASPGTVSGLTSGVGGATADSFSGIQSFVGAATIVSPVTAVPPTLPAATVGLAYSQQLSGSGGASPYSSFAVEDGSLPAGLSLSPAGLLTGSPTAGGTFSFVVTLLDALDLPGATSYQVTVNPPTTSLPTITSVSPSFGPEAGGTPVTIAGTNFAPGATTVAFGSNAATSVSCASATTCTATSPAGTGTVDVTVTTSAGTSATSSADAFSYLPPARPYQG